MRTRRYPRQSVTAPAEHRRGAVVQPGSAPAGPTCRCGANGVFTASCSIVPRMRRTVGPMNQIADMTPGTLGPSLATVPASPRSEPPTAPAPAHGILAGDPLRDALLGKPAALARPGRGLRRHRIRDRCRRLLRVPVAGHHHGLADQRADRPRQRSAAAGCRRRRGVQPVRADITLRNRRVWLKRPDGELCWMSVSVAPLLDRDGAHIGSRGVGRDVTDTTAPTRDGPRAAPVGADRPHRLAHAHRNPRTPHDEAGVAGADRHAGRRWRADRGKLRNRAEAAARSGWPAGFERGAQCPAAGPAARGRRRCRVGSRACDRRAARRRQRPARDVRPGRPCLPGLRDADPVRRLSRPRHLAQPDPACVRRR